MTRKMLIKVTVDEALFPELYQRLDEFENPRLRAAALRSLANDTARFPAVATRDLILVGKPSGVSMEVQQPAGTPPPTDISATMVSSDPIVAAHPGARDPDVMTDLSHRFDVDAIADQFAGF